MAQTAVTDRVRIAKADDPWGGTLLPREDDTYVAAALHRRNLLGVWKIAPDRQIAPHGPEKETGYHPDSVAAWDANTLVVAVEGAGLIQFWHIAASDMQKTAELRSAFPVRDLVTGDFDGDGHTDLVTAPYNGDQLAVYWGEGDTRLSAPMFIPAGRSPWHPVVHDWDGDGRPDLLWAELDTGAVKLARSEAGRAFEVVELHRVSGTTPRHIAVGDVNRDGREDIVVAVEVGAAEVLLATGEGGLQVEKIPPQSLGYVAAGVMQDGTVVLGEDEQLLLARRSGAGWEMRRLPAGSLPTPLRVADIDRDGIEDVLVFNSAGGGIDIQFGPLWERAKPLE
ncbi:FG-GAP repeat domain-containing protein [Aromatoleum buckelii]|uniref:VCBS repeat-containing protein n=1 Tax=Aromatoleum buckelii TaxID=200254 RepID=A0ABX1N688_9RHOO|nr:VCBS repeat-containing protein [Aromatoleum buckelii]MCK0511896.1 VCBS repeat-containing protein [Aromatoleum buckelii]